MGNRLRYGMRRGGALLVLLLLAGCPRPPAMLYVENPFERYDHNRTLNLLVPGSPVVVIDRTYTPESSPPFFAASDERSAPAPDQGPAAIVVPLFTGLPLPLSQHAGPRTTTRSDFDDLVGYLVGEGRGVPGREPDEGSFDRAEGLRSYGPLLDLLSQPGLDRAKVKAASERLKLQVLTGPAIRDARFPPAFFMDRVALRCAGHWFILYRPQNTAHFSRLTVVAYRPTSQEQERKKPTADLEPCQ